VESEEDYSAYIREVLEPYGLHVELYADGNRALNEWRSDTPALFIICVEPRSIGYAVCARARKTPHLSAVPLILYSGEATAEQFEQHRKIKTHANEYLFKPFEADDLLVVVDQLIGLGQGDPTDAQDYSQPDNTPEPLFDPHDLSAENVLGRESTFEPTATDVPAYSYAPTGVSHRGASPPMSIGGDEVVLSQEQPAPRRPLALSASTDLETEAAFAAIQERDDPSAAVAEEQSLSETELAAIGDEEVEILSNSGDVGPPSARAVLPPPPGPAAPRVSAAAAYGEAASEGSARPPMQESVTETTRSPRSEVSKELPGKDPKLGDSRPLSASGDTGYFAREREYLTLREAVNRKEKEILDLKDERDAKERTVLDYKEKLRELERSSREVESKLLAMERELVEARETSVLMQRDKEAAVASEQRALANLGELSNILERTKSEAAVAGRHHADSMEALRAQQAASLDDQRKAHELELSTLRGRHSLELDKHRTELRNEAEAAMGRALTEAATRAKVEQDGLLAAAERRRTADLEAARVAHQAALEGARRSHEEELARLRGEHEAATALRQREHVEEMQRVAQELARRTEELQVSRGETDEVRRQVDALARSLSSSTNERDRLSAQLADEAERTTSLATELARSKDRGDELDQSLRGARARIDELERQLADTRVQLAATRGQLTTDESAMERAKKALALAIVVLDEARPPSPTAATTAERPANGIVSAEQPH
jgi:CheY-like chemotaxis protein